MPARVRRFFYVGAPQGSIVHCSSSRTFTEGSPTWCGAPMRKGWLYWIGRRSLPKTRKFCKRCANVET